MLRSLISAAVRRGWLLILLAGIICLGASLAMLSATNAKLFSFASDCRPGPPIVSR